MWPVLWGGSSTECGGVLTDRLALILGGLLVALIVCDLALNGGGALLFLLRKFADLVEWLSFWR